MTRQLSGRGRSVPGMAAIARFDVVALDCPDADALGRFYGALTGWEPRRPYPGHGWVQLDPPDEGEGGASRAVGAGAAGVQPARQPGVRCGRGATIAFQEVAGYRPPQWPGQEHPQQAHLDFAVPDLDAGEAAVLAIGARKHLVQPAPESFRVFLDPAGHPFCLVREG